MTRRARAARLLALAALLALLSLERLRDEPHQGAVPAPSPRAPAPSPPPEASAPNIEPAPEARASPAPPRAARRRAQKPPPRPPAVLLDDLLRIPVEGPQSPGPLELPPPPVADAPAAKPAQRVRIDFSSREPLGESPVPRAWRQSEAGVSVPMDEAERLRVRGGVRVDQRGEGEVTREVETTPSFGLEFRF